MQDVYKVRDERQRNRKSRYPNAQAESFMKMLKVEEVYLAGYETFADVARRLPIFIEQVYNTRRLHSALGYRPPEEFETLIAQQAA